MAVRGTPSAASRSCTFVIFRETAARAAFEVVAVATVDTKIWAVSGRTVTVPVPVKRRYGTSGPGSVAAGAAWAGGGAPGVELLGFSARAVASSAAPPRTASGRR